MTDPGPGIFATISMNGCHHCLFHCLSGAGLRRAPAGLELAPDLFTYRQPAENTGYLFRRTIRPTLTQCEAGQSYEACAVPLFIFGRIRD